jgi:hypothetical protein
MKRCSRWLRPKWSVEGELRCKALGQGAKMGTTPGERSWTGWQVGFRNGEEVTRQDHAARDTSTEFLNLSADVAEEGIAGPATDEHDGEHWEARQVHGHGGARADGVEANVVVMEAQRVGA